MKTRLLSPLACAIALTSLPVASWAADPSVSFNIGAVSDYRYRGYSQSRLQPAVQGGMDVTAGAWYLGAWASSIKWVKDGGGDSSIEVDLYGGYKGEVKDAFAYDLGVLTYVYPSNALPTSANTTELYGALSVGPITLKYSHSLTNLFGTRDVRRGRHLGHPARGAADREQLQRSLLHRLFAAGEQGVRRRHLERRRRRHEREQDPLRHARGQVHRQEHGGRRRQVQLLNPHGEIYEDGDRDRQALQARRSA
jgi:hypothetical protein